MNLRLVFVIVLTLSMPALVHAREEKPVSMEAIMEEIATLRSLVESQQRQIEELRAKTKGDTVVIVSSEGPHLTLTVGRPKRSVAPDWHSHFEWLRKQPVII